MPEKDPAMRLQGVVRGSLKFLVPERLNKGLAPSAPRPAVLPGGDSLFFSFRATIFVCVAFISI
jgi:hypothetical protein